MTQVDIGYDTAKYLWFLNYWSKTRWLRGSVYVHDGKITLDKVPIDTYAWSDQINEKISHGRFRFYENVSLDMPMSQPPFHDSITIKGKEDKLQFVKYEVEKAVIKYKVASMEWEIQVDQHKLLTRDIKGIVSGKIDNQPRHFIIENATILHSWLVTLVNCQLEITP